MVSGVFGYHAVQLSADAQAEDLLSASQVVSRHRFHLSAQQTLVGPLHAATDALPFADECLQLVVVDHLLHWVSAAPILAEIERSLAPEGVLIIALCRSGKARRSLPNMVHRGGQKSLMRQLQRLNLKTLLVRPLSFPPLWAKGLERVDRFNIIRGSWLAGVASGYLLVAQKPANSITIMRLRRQRTRKHLAPSTAGQAWRSRQQ